MAVAVPAFASSVSLPSAEFSPDSCRCVNDKLYKLAITFTNPTASSVLIAGTSLTAVLRSIDFPSGQTATAPPGTSTATFFFTNSNNAIGLQLTFVYDVRDAQTGQVLARDQVLSGAVTFPQCDLCPTQNG